VAAPHIRDGDVRHIAMNSIRMQAGKSMSQINSYAESNKCLLYVKKCDQALAAGILICFRSSNKRASFLAPSGFKLKA
jgi:hypothetical protein